MILPSDLQIWQTSVSGINQFGKTDLRKEEWTALMVLNKSLSSGNFDTDENRRSIIFLRDNLSRHEHNYALYEHLLDFITLCTMYIPEDTLPSIETGYMETANTEEAFDLSTITRDKLLFLLNTAKDEITRYTRCSEETKSYERYIDSEKMKYVQNRNSLLGISIVPGFILLFFIFFVITYVIGDFMGFFKDARNFNPARESGVLTFCGIVSIALYIVFIRWRFNKQKKKYQSKLEGLQFQLSELEKKEDDAMSKFNAIYFIPDDYWYEYALSQMLKFVENKRADNWKEVSALYEEHFHRLKMEENAQQRLEEAMRQTELARETRNASRMAAAGAWASAAGIWRISSKL